MQKDCFGSHVHAIASSSLLLLLLQSCASAPVRPTVTGPASDVGVVVMAHGGPPGWNAGVLTTVEPLRARHPLEVAFGMADAASLQESVRKLEARGVRRIAVVRLFVSGESWLERTQQILGVRAGAPDHDHAASDHAHAEHSMAFFRIQTHSAFALSTSGLADAEGMGRVLADRALALSKQPDREDVLILAHGPADDAENERWLRTLDERAAAVRACAAFRRVEVATLREDWPDKRAAAELHVRAIVERAAADGGKAIVIPFRVHGFGPYADVLAGVDYVADEQGLIPHPEVGRWIETQIVALEAGPFESQVPR